MFSAQGFPALIRLLAPHRLEISKEQEENQGQCPGQDSCWRTTPKVKPSIEEEGSQTGKLAVRGFGYPARLFGNAAAAVQAPPGLAQAVGTEVTGNTKGLLLPRGWPSVGSALLSGTDSTQGATSYPRVVSTAGRASQGYRLHKLPHQGWP